MTLKPNEAEPVGDRGVDGRTSEQWTDDQSANQWTDGQSSDQWTDGRTYQLLANARRRECVRHLRASSGGAGVSVRDLADAVADALPDDGAATDRLRRSVYTSLSQHHLDRLDRCDVVDYDRDRQVVAPGSNFGTVARGSVDAEPQGRPMRRLACWTSALTVLTLLLSSVAQPRSATLPVLAAVVLNLFPVGLFVRSRFDGGR